jgi:hypothetical protein
MYLHGTHTWHSHHVLWVLIKLAEPTTSWETYHCLCTQNSHKQLDKPSATSNIARCLQSLHTQPANIQHVAELRHGRPLVVLGRQAFSRYLTNTSNSSELCALEIPHQCSIVVQVSYLNQIQNQPGVQDCLGNEKDKLDGKGNVGRGGIC